MQISFKQQILSTHPIPNRKHTFQIAKSGYVMYSI